MCDVCGRIICPDGCPNAGNSKSAPAVTVPDNIAGYCGLCGKLIRFGEGGLSGPESSDGKGSFICPDCLDSLSVAGVLRICGIPSIGGLMYELGFNVI